MFNKGIEWKGFDKGNFAGFCGEVRFTTILNCLIQDNAALNVLAAGGVKEAGKDIPIDIFLNSFGFQIKNITFTTESTKQWKYSMGNPSISSLLDTLQMDGVNASIIDILTLFYSTSLFNVSDNTDPQFTALYNKFIENADALFAPIGRVYAPSLYHIQAEIGDTGFQEEWLDL